MKSSRQRNFLRGLLAFLTFVVAGAAPAEEKPLWEAGLGVGALRFPDYRGSDESHVFPVPVPYFVYRGHFFKADKDGARGSLFNRRYAEFSVSVNATIPVYSENNDARRGMPDLKPTIEIGPSLNLHLWRSADEEIKFDLVMPLRVPLTLESSPQFIGWMFAPRFNLDIDDVAGSGWDFGIGLGPLYANDEFHQYFYSVQPEYATEERPAYQAHGGYSGMHLLTALSKRFPNYWIGAYLRYDALDSAVFGDSPLMRSNHSLAGGIGIAWMIGQSKKLVETDD